MLFGDLSQRGQQHIYHGGTVFAIFLSSKIEVAWLLTDPFSFLIVIRINDLTALIRFERVSTSCF